MVLDVQFLNPNAWVLDVQIPADRTGISLGFSVLSDSNTEELIEILEEDWPVRNPSPGTDSETLARAFCWRVPLRLPLHTPEPPDVLCQTPSLALRSCAASSTPLKP